MRLLPRSPTNSRPLKSIARAWGVSNSLAAVPFLPQVLMNFPSFENFTMRALESPPCPSATKMSPFGAVVTSDGRLKVSGPSPATPALPSVSKTFPSGLNLTTWWPLPSFPSASVTHTLPSLSTWMPCGNTNIPADRDGNVWVTDADGKEGKGHQVVKFSANGKILLTLGKAGVAGDGPDTFNRPSDVTTAPNGDIFVADGHGGDSNARIVKFSK